MKIINGTLISLITKKIHNFTLQSKINKYEENNFY